MAELKYFKMHSPFMKVQNKVIKRIGHKNPKWQIYTY